MGKYQIEFGDNLPPEYHSLSERALVSAIEWLDAQPRPKSVPPIENFAPNWAEMSFTLADSWGRGMFDMHTGKGWAVVHVRLNGDAVLGLDKPIVIEGVDIELATAVGAVGMLDGYYYKGIDSDRQLRRQLQFIDELSATNAKAKSLLDQLDEAIKAKEEAERLAVYEAQFPLKAQQYKDRLTRVRHIRTPSWWWQRHPDAPVSQHESPETQPKQQPQPSAAAAAVVKHEAPAFTLAPIAKREQMPLVSPCSSEAAVIEQQKKFWAEVESGSHSTTCEADPCCRGH
jgi:hypothetical protein